MNKFKFFLIAVALVLTSNAAMSQQKTGYIDINIMIQIMPDAARIDSLMEKYQQDSLASQFTVIFNDYKYYDSLLNSKDTAKIPASVKQQYQNNVQNLGYQLQNWQSISGQLYQAKQNQYLAPVYDKVMKTIQAIAKEKGYTHVYDKSVFIVAPTGDDLLTPVAQRLNVKVPAQVPIGVNAAAK